MKGFAGLGPVIASDYLSVGNCRSLCCWGTSEAGVFGSFPLTTSDLKLSQCWPLILSPAQTDPLPTPNKLDKSHFFVPGSKLPQPIVWCQNHRVKFSNLSDSGSENRWMHRFHSQTGSLDYLVCLSVHHKPEKYTQVPLYWAQKLVFDSIQHIFQMTITVLPGWWVKLPLA